ncbi:MULTISPECIES: PD-(D/E)XK nuclease family protein [Weeksella]|uniref:PD-(D/E)XK endonuclease-like domain-containing protein n=1 Tax=Weeksella virosa (strain ATCC 43766 / DSM 16922 / JCM 21250 / CCUG 30538 / CDC 9751 / IAM 14551 / NBRC 16016 / NCTC 11634 / CL345/78) TaxID=865938 RepID=F0P2F1_WEEVC|nr:MULTISPECIES: PD-(D/E)XK nuclease family protein [Weeksella]ADX66763.1 hypothetical protein Weevi_0035 [Weeksella virosa DSM 16922]MDK7374764.1 PD-(D/E)XK nuclease family protein [Weeksella virosa]OFM85443.1 hypothetical protein HMPREF2660_07745 [Weeksella sp. HMSC059D05]VEH63514.1 Inactivated superfamily I helicase [Weeksella virosa]
MSKFIDKVVDELLKDTEKLLQTTLVLPGKRPMLFFKKAFQQKTSQVVLPKMISIEEFVSEMANVQLISGLSLWFFAYNSYEKVFPDLETFDDFLKWAPTTLKDFDDLDASLVDTDHFFEYMVSIERIKNWGLEIGEADKHTLIQRHLEFNERVKLFYNQFRKDLLTEKKAYYGLANRLAAEQINQAINSPIEYVFAGFNALTKAEEAILFGLENEQKAKIFWDADEYYLQPQQESGAFLRRHKKKTKKQWSWTFNDFASPKQIQVTGISKNVAQAKYVNELLRHKTEEELKNTALILADEMLLPALLNAMPNNVKHINISMGIPLKNIPLAHFFKSILELHMNREKLGNSTAFYFKNILDILENPSLKIFHCKNDEQLIAIIHSQNKVFSSVKFLQDFLIDSIFSPLFSRPNNLNDLLSIIEKFIADLFVNPKIDNDLMREYLFYFQQIFTSLRTEIATLKASTSFRTLYLLYQKLLQSETLSFIGEPLDGLQVMGLLETRLINFDHLIMTSVNDGILPLGRQNNTFIPYDIRKEKGLNTFTENDAIYAYHFYRLLSRAKTVHFLYNTDSDAMGSGEKSRFLEQIAYESSHEVVINYAKPHFEIIPKNKLVIPKTPKTMEKLIDWAENIGISPTLLSTYIRNPIEFYERVILSNDETEEAEETISAKTLGKIVHGTLETLYQDYLNIALHEKDFEEIKNKVDEVLEANLKKEYKEGELDRGENLLIKNVARKIVEGVLQRDKKIAQENELVILFLEKKYNFLMDIGDRKVKVKGFIDRIDSVNGTKRIIDYKTGKIDNLNLASDKIEEVFEMDNKAKYLQLITYAHLYYNEIQQQEEEIQLSIYPIKFLNKEPIYLHYNKSTMITYKIVEDSLTYFQNLIREILNPEIPFEEKINN